MAAPRQAVQAAADPTRMGTGAKGASALVSNLTATAVLLLLCYQFAHHLMDTAASDRQACQTQVQAIRQQLDGLRDDLRQLRRAERDKAH
jgi:hypothetical protein